MEACAADESEPTGLFRAVKKLWRPIKKRTPSANVMNALPLAPWLNRLPFRHQMVKLQRRLVLWLLLRLLEKCRQSFGRRKY